MRLREDEVSSEIAAVKAEAAAAEIASAAALAATAAPTSQFSLDSSGSAAYSLVLSPKKQVSVGDDGFLSASAKSCCGAEGDASSGEYWGSDLAVMSQGIRGAEEESGKLSCEDLEQEGTVSANEPRKAEKRV